MSAKIWHAIAVTARPAAREALEWGLMNAGALGTETTDAADTITVTAYYEAAQREEEVRRALTSALRFYGLDDSALIDLTTREFADQDWLAEWKKDWQPVRVGRFIVAPPWISEAGASDESILITINPGMAFGTGTHETTRLCLKAIEKYFRGGSFLDVGTGTGILAIAAARMFPDARIEACDNDADAIVIARENAELNGVGSKIDFRVGSVDDQTASANLVCANLTAPVLAELLPALAGATCGRLVLSGILETQVGMMEARLSDLGTSAIELEQDGEWVALVI